MAGHSRKSTSSNSVVSRPEYHSGGVQSTKNGEEDWKKNLPSAIDRFSLAHSFFGVLSAVCRTVNLLIFAILPVISAFSKANFFKNEHVYWNLPKPLVFSFTKQKRLLFFAIFLCLLCPAHGSVPAPPAAGTDGDKKEEKAEPTVVYYEPSIVTIAPPNETTMIMVMKYQLPQPQMKIPRMDPVVEPPHVPEAKIIQMDTILIPEHSPWIVVMPTGPLQLGFPAYPHFSMPIPPAGVLLNPPLLPAAAPPPAAPPPAAPPPPGPTAKKKRINLKKFLDSEESEEPDVSLEEEEEYSTDMEMSENVAEFEPPGNLEEEERSMGRRDADYPGMTPVEPARNSLNYSAQIGNFSSEFENFKGKEEDSDTVIIVIAALTGIICVVGFTLCMVVAIRIFKGQKVDKFGRKVAENEKQPRNFENSNETA